MLHGEPDSPSQRAAPHSTAALNFPEVGKSLRAVAFVRNDANEPADFLRIP
jgi:hypothetical protein